MARALYSDYFCGNQASEYGRQNGYLDVATFAKAFDAVMANSLMSDTADIGYWEQVNGMIDNGDEIDARREEIEELDAQMCEMIDEDRENTPEYKDIEDRRQEIESEIEELEAEQDNQPECFQFFIVSAAGAELIQQYTDDPLFYNGALDLYLWGITHWGTSWDYVLTDIKLNAGEEAFN